MINFNIIIHGKYLVFCRTFMTSLIVVNKILQNVFVADINEFPVK